MKLPKTKSELITLCKENPKLTGLGLGVFIVLLLWLFSGSSTIHTPEALIHKPEVSGVKASVDPRDIWTDAIGKEISALSNKMEDAFKAQAENHKSAITELKKDMDGLRSDNKADSKEAEIKVKQEEPSEPEKQEPQMVYLHQNFNQEVHKDTDDYVTSGSFARAVLLTGVVAETGTESAGTPQPILLRLVDVGIFSKGYKTKQIKEAILIGSCYGNLSSERAMCRLESLSLKNSDGDIVERPIEGWLIDSADGRPGVKGDVIDKSSNMARMAVLNGILGGMAGFFQAQATSGVYPISPISGPANALGGLASVKAGASSGVGNALQKLAEYAIKRAEQMSPVIVVGSARIVDVVFRKGFQLKDITPINNTTNVTSVSDKKEKAQTPTAPPVSTEGDKRNKGYNQAVNSLENFQMNKGTY